MANDRPMQRRRTSTGSDVSETPMNCCYAFLLLFMFLFCLLEMKPRTRICLTWFYVISGSVLAGVLVYRHNAEISVSISPTDMRPLDSISNDLCSSVDIASSSVFNIYDVPTQPVISDNPEDKLIFRKTFINTIQFQYFTKWTFYHLSGTVAEVLACGQTGLKLVIIKGADNFREWLDKEDCGTCVEYRYLLAECESRSQTEHFVVDVAKTDDYYYVMINEALDDRPKHVETELVITETRYDVSDGVKVCSGVTTCSVELSFKTKSVIIERTADGMFDSTVSVSCSPRAYVYVLLFVALPIILGTLFTYIILRCAQRSRSESENENGSDVFTVSGNEQSCGFDNPNFRHTMAPPSYCEAPPSYDEVIAEQRGSNSQRMET